jgi:hypothetical protein
MSQGDYLPAARRRRDLPLFLPPGFRTPPPIADFIMRIMSAYLEISQEDATMTGYLQLIPFAFWPGIWTIFHHIFKKYLSPPGQVIIIAAKISGEEALGC